MGLFIGQLGELVYNVQTVPNCPSNHEEYKVTGSLQSFSIYNYFCVTSIRGRHVSPVAMSPASHLRRIKTSDEAVVTTFSPQS
jgi:hypothetical protein